jgi:hypothetical protein
LEIRIENRTERARKKLERAKEKANASDTAKTNPKWAKKTPLLCRKVQMTIASEDQKKQSLDIFIRALQSAPDSFIKSLTGQEYAEHIVDGAKVIMDYLYPKK